MKFFIRKGVFVFDEKDQLIAIAGSAGVGSASECSASLTDVYRYSHSFTLPLPDDHAGEDEIGFGKISLFYMKD